MSTVSENTTLMNKGCRREKGCVQSANDPRTIQCCQGYLCNAPMLIEDNVFETQGVTSGMSDMVQPVFIL